jgi:hypothetical protein
MRACTARRACAGNHSLLPQAAVISVSPAMTRLTQPPPQHTDAPDTFFFSGITDNGCYTIANCPLKIHTMTFTASSRMLNGLPMRSLPPFRVDCTRFCTVASPVRNTMGVF